MFSRHRLSAARHSRAAADAGTRVARTASASRREWKASHTRDLAFAVVGDSDGADEGKSERGRMRNTFDPLVVVVASVTPVYTPASLVYPRRASQMRGLVSGTACLLALLVPCSSGGAVRRETCLATLCGRRRVAASEQRVGTSR